MCEGDRHAVAVVLQTRDLVPKQVLGRVAGALVEHACQITTQDLKLLGKGAGVRVLSRERGLGHILIINEAKALLPRGGGANGSLDPQVAHDPSPRTMNVDVLPTTSECVGTF